MIARKTALEQTEPNCLNGILGVRIVFLVVEDGIVTESKWHRTMIPVHYDPAEQMATVNEHLSMMEPPMPPVSQADIDFVAQCHALLKQRMELQ